MVGCWLAHTTAAAMAARAVVLMADAEARKRLACRGAHGGVACEGAQGGGNGG